tara:strand:+ start:216 stop:533 length:318 start_codon:yes stop_codon:yes gene_type:complete
MTDTIYDRDYINSNGQYECIEKPISPKTQAEADAIYYDLGMYMSDEAIFQDGEASLTNAIQTFTFYLRKAKRVKALGFLPTIECDVFYPKGYVPTSWKQYREGTR